MPRRTDTLAALLAAASLLAAPAARADGRGDHDRARAAREAGRVLPLRELLARVEADQPGSEVLEVELEEERGRLLYEIKLLAPGGRVREALYDAATGEPVAGGKERD